MKRKAIASKIPQVNLVPMIDVLMSVLIFFVILSMSLTNQLIPSVELPELEKSIEEGVDAETEGEVVPTPPAKLVVGLNKDSQIVLDGAVADEAQLTEAIKLFLSENPEGIVQLNAHRTLGYQEVERVLQTMSEVGGGQVSLVVE